jgi:hypothetical protein
MLGRAAVAVFIAGEPFGQLVDLLLLPLDEGTETLELLAPILGGDAGAAGVVAGAAGGDDILGLLEQRGSCTG